MWVKSCQQRRIEVGGVKMKKRKNDLQSGKPGEMNKGKHKWKIRVESTQDHNPSQILKSKILWKFSFFCWLIQKQSLTMPVLIWQHDLLRTLNHINFSHLNRLIISQSAAETLRCLIMPCCPKLLLGVLTIRYRFCITFSKI